ncbi:hypothetical protein H0H92_009209, partial [Tricholoma furcatifolium]
MDVKGQPHHIAGGGRDHLSETDGWVVDAYARECSATCAELSCPNVDDSARESGGVMPMLAVLQAIQLTYVNSNTPSRNAQRPSLPPHPKDPQPLPPRRTPAAAHTPSLASLVINAPRPSIILEFLAVYRIPRNP